MLYNHLLLSFRKQIKMLTGFSICANLMFLAFPLYSLQVYDRVLNTGSLSTLVWLFLIVMLCSATGSILGAINGYCINNFVHIWIRPVRDYMVKFTIQQMAVRNGRINGSQLIKDVDTLKNFLCSHSFFNLLDAPWGVLYLGMLFFISTTLGFMALAGIVLMLMLAAVNLLSIQRAAGKLQGKTMEGTQQIDRALLNSEAIHAMGMANSLCSRWQVDYLALQRLHSDQQKQIYMLEAFSRFSRVIVQLVIMSAAAYLVTQRELSTGGIMASSMLATRTFSPFETLFLNWQRLTETKKAWERIAAALENPAPAATDEIPLDTIKGAIKVEGLVYGLSSVMAQMIIKNVTFQLAPGELIAIVGPVASGKSTLARLLLGIIPPVSGDVRLDGVNIRHYKREQLGGIIGYVPQNIQLFSGTVRDNISRFVRDVDEKDVIAAATFCGVHDMILRMPEGYNTSADTLSAGQAQLIALARAFYGSPKVVVLDEPDSALEPQSERIIAYALQQAHKAGITTIIISHRPYVISQVNIMMVLKNGSIEHFGQRQDVLAKIDAARLAAQQPKEQRIS
jgi:PrtD family type I secretion system ABC transporter